TAIPPMLRNRRRAGVSITAASRLMNRMHSRGEQTGGWPKLAAITLAAFVVAELVSLGLEHTREGQELLRAGQRTIGSRIGYSAADSHHDLAVTICDISAFRKMPHEDNLEDNTSRDDLLSLLRRAVDCGPLAIGVDVDFSPKQSDDGPKYIDER